MWKSNNRHGLSKQSITFHNLFLVTETYRTTGNESQKSIDRRKQHARRKGESTMNIKKITYKHQNNISFDLYKNNEKFGHSSHYDRNK